MKAAYIVLGVIIAAAILRWSPADHFLEAGRPAYYQARIAYIRGDESQRDKITAAFQDGKISMHDYSETVFPSYLKVARDHEELFPGDESFKTTDEQRDNLKRVITQQRDSASR